jgi:RimJ/RimL family protein N-acetyltransferase
MVDAEGIKVRKAEASDAAAILELRDKLLTETSFMLWEPGKFHFSVEDEAKRIDPLNGRANCLMIVAEQRGHLIGTLSAYGGDTRRIRHRATVALGVAREHWGKGAATAMLEFVLRWSLERRLRRIELTVHTSNDRAVAVYKRCGFKVEGVRRSSLRAATDAAKTHAAERRRLEAENTRLRKLIDKRAGEVEALRDRLARAETSLEESSAQLKAEQGKFSMLLSRVRPAAAVRLNAAKGAPKQRPRKRISA